MRWLIDEMFPADVADRLNELGHDARAVVRGLRGWNDEQLFDLAMAEQRVAVTENVIDFVALLEARIMAGEAAAAVLFVLEAGLPSSPGRLASQLSRRLDAWGKDHPEPAVTAYWL